MAAEQCPYCGRFMAVVDYGAAYGTEMVCSKQRQHALSDPEHWMVPELDALGCRWQRPEAGCEDEGYSCWVHNAPWGECLDANRENQRRSSMLAPDEDPREWECPGCEDDENASHNAWCPNRENGSQ